MNGMKKSIVVTLLLAIVLCARLAPAMEIQMFDSMAIQDQKAYLKFLVKDAQKILIEQDQRDQAAKVRELFQRIPRGDHRSLGETQFEESLAIDRVFIAENRGGPLRPPVEASLIVTLNKNGIKTPPSFFRNLTQLVKQEPFWPKKPLRKN